MYDISYMYDICMILHADSLHRFYHCWDFVWNNDYRKMLFDVLLLQTTVPNLKFILFIKSNYRK